MTQPTGTRRKLYAVLCVLGCLAALAVEAFTVTTFLDAISVNSWPTVEGTILRSKIESSPTGYKAFVEYEFQLDGETYKSSSVRTRGTSTKHKFDVEAVVAKFPVGSKCTVFYREGAPEVSYLEAGVGIINYVIIVSPLLFALLFGAAGWEFLQPPSDNDSSEP